MTHLILCREYPPAPYPAGGIGTYARHIARLLAEAGETVHMIAQRWEGAAERISTSLDGRLVVHRIALDEAIVSSGEDAAEQQQILKLLMNSDCPTQVFSWQAARYAERLIEAEPIDVIEAQEWEAPLYYLQARRAVGLGPGRRPPCIVHLHSPTQMIFEFNEWDQTLADFRPLARLEEWSILAADALLCPSHYLAAQVTQRFRLEPGRIHVIPYPMGVETPVLQRGVDVWSRNAVCYVGRLELRKGVVEWVDAAVSVAATHPTVSFDFFGSDTSVGGGTGRSVLSLLQARIPRDLKPRFHFHGSRSRAELLQALANVSIAVVPSRWENFPFTCIEAMSTGLPVLASPNGGMAEMMAGNGSGWIASDGSAQALATALRRALATPANERAAMGASAAQAIRRMCDNDTIVARQIALRKQVAKSTLTPAQAFTHTSPWILYGKDDLDPGPSLDRDCLTYPGPPIMHRPPRRQARRRYSGMALIANQSAGFAFTWFLGAPFSEKLRWLSRIAAKPRRLLDWLGFRFRTVAGASELSK
jgi:glycosyltransferase involved in cell wall biosynthesis